MLSNPILKKTPVKMTIQRASFLKDEAIFFFKGDQKGELVYLLGKKIGSEDLPIPSFFYNLMNQTYEIKFKAEGKKAIELFNKLIKFLFEENYIDSESYHQLSNTFPVKSSLHSTMQFASFQKNQTDDWGLDSTLGSIQKVWNIEDQTDFDDKKTDEYHTNTIYEFHARNRSELQLAVRQGKLDLVQEEIKKGVDINYQDKSLKTALHDAVAVNNPKLVEFLIAHGAKQEIIDEHKCTPLKLAMQKNHIEIAKLLLSKIDKLNVSYLIDAIEHGSLDIFKLIISKCHLLDINAKINHETLLCKATTKGNVDIAKYLIEELKADPNIPNGRSFTPYDIALEEGNADVARYLKTKTNTTKIHTTDAKERSLKIAEEYKDTPTSEEYNDPTVDIFLDLFETKNIHRAAEHEKGIEQIKLLFELENIPVDKRNKKGETALHKASEHHRLDTIKFLIEQKADLEAVDKNRETPLLKAGNHFLTLSTDKKTDDTKDIIQYFIEEAKVNANAVDKTGKTILHKAVYSLPAVQYLVKLNPELVNMKDQYGYTPLMTLLFDYQEHSLPIVKYLVNEGKAELENSTWMGTPLLMAASGIEMGDRFEVVKYLIEAKANVSARDKKGEGLLHHVVRSGKPEQLKYFIDELKLDLNTKDNKGFTAFDAAVQYRNIETVRFLARILADQERKTAFVEKPAEEKGPFKQGLALFHPFYGMQLVSEEKPSSILQLSEDEYRKGRLTEAHLILKSYSKYEYLEKGVPAEINYHLAKIVIAQANQESALDKKIQLLQEAKDYCEKAKELNYSSDKINILMTQFENLYKEANICKHDGDRLSI